jgi:hypothetical protein
VVIAAIAVFTAARSAMSAARSAAAAQRTAAAASEDAHQVKRLVGRMLNRNRADENGSTNGEAGVSVQKGAPELAATLTMALELHARSVISRATVENSGDAPADNVLVSFLAPKTVPFREFGRDGQVGSERLLGNEAPGIELASADGSPVQARRHSRRVEHLAPGEREHWFTQLFLDSAGDFQLELRAGHKEGVPVRQRYSLQVAPEGEASIEPIAV